MSKSRFYDLMGIFNGVGFVGFGAAYNIFGRG